MGREACEAREGSPAVGQTAPGGPKEYGKREAATQGDQETAEGQETGPVTEGRAGRAFGLQPSRLGRASTENLEGDQETKAEQEILK